MKAVVAAFNQEKALVGAFSVLTNLRMQFGCNFLKHYTQAEAATEAETEAGAGAGEAQRSSIRVTYSDHHPSRPQPEEVSVT